MIGGDGVDLLDDDLLEERLHLRVGVLVVGPGHQVAVAEAMEQVVDGLAAHRDPELALEDPADIGGPEGTDAVLGRGRGLDPLPEPGVVLRGQGAWPTGPGLLAEPSMPPRLYWATQFLTERSEQPRLWAIWAAVHPCLARRTAWTLFQDRFWGMASARTWSWSRL